VKILRAKFQNFLTIKEGDVKLADRGLVLIQGENNRDTSADSNGAGKSSLPDGICWALYGVTARGEDGDKVVNLSAKKDCMVTVDIEDGDDVYRINRYRKHKQHKNLVQLLRLDTTGAITDLTKGTNALTQIEIDKVIGCSYDVFKSAVYAGQEMMPDLPGMTDKQLKLLIEEASGATLLEAAYKEANTRVTAAKGILDGFQRQVQLQSTRLTDAQNRFATLKTSYKDYESRRADQVVELTRLAKSERDFAVGVADRLSKFDKPTTLSVIKRLEAMIDGSADERKKEKELEARVLTATQTVTSAQVQLRTLKSQADREKKEHDDAKHQIGCPCNACSKPITAQDVKPVQDAIAARYRATVASFNAAKTELEDAQKSLQSVTDELSKHRASMTDLSATNASLREMRNDLNTITGLEQAKETHVQKAKGYVERLNEVKKAENPFAAQIERMDGEIEDIETRLKELSEEVDGAVALVKASETVARVFSPAGVRAFMLDEVTPFLNDQTAKYLGTLSDGNITATWSTLVPDSKGNLKEKFSIEVVHAEGGDTFKSVSGGEKRKVRIAAALALQDLVARRATKPIELFIGDEIDDALDPAGLERLMQILEEKARERGSVFVISHNNLKDWISNTITVVKKAKWESTLEEASA
jgi:DNA repair exonuclease SbcCD ATPase subunit